MVNSRAQVHCKVTPTNSMKMNVILVVTIASVLLPTVHSAGSSVAWCYNDPTCNDATWPSIATKYCNGSRQSPIDIVSASAMGDSTLTAFTFTKYAANSTISTIKNTGNTVQVDFSPGAQVSGGGLSEAYDSLQMHLHWGNLTSVPGSEHTVDGKQYPMELHIVNVKSSLNLNTTLAVADSTGLAALGFFIEAASGNATGSPASWKTLTSYLASITKKGDSLDISGSGISLDDLLPGVDRTKYYRYMGSLTTPNCNEAVVWTVFKDSVKISSDLINLFSTTVRFNTTASDLMTSNFRVVQSPNGRQVTTQTSAGLSLTSSTASYTLGLLTLAWLLKR